MRGVTMEAAYLEIKQSQNSNGAALPPRPLSVLRAVPDTDSSRRLHLAKAGTVLDRRQHLGPHLSLLGPAGAVGDALPSACPADSLQLCWSEPDSALDLVLHGPGQPLPRQPHSWVLTLPLEPLLLEAIQHGLHNDLVVDCSQPQQLGHSAGGDLAETAAALVGCAERGQTTVWLLREQQLIQQLCLALQRPLTQGQPRRDRGWRHLLVSLSWMAEHLADDFSLADLAGVACITPRALQIAYRKHLDKRPLQSLRLLRLAKLRESLLANSPESGRLLDHLVRCGLSASGNTARHYRERYGETPSQTRS